MDYETAQGELRSLISAKMYEVAKQHPAPLNQHLYGMFPEVYSVPVESVAEEIVDFLCYEHPQVLDALGERPSRAWIMRDCERQKLVWLGGDEWGHRPLVLWIGWGRYLCLNLRPRLRTEREPMRGSL